MVLKDTAFDSLAVLYPGIAGRRKSDPVLDEICCDYEALTLMAKPSGADVNADAENLHKDLRMTIRALQEEIRDRLNKSG